MTMEADNKLFMKIFNATTQKVRSINKNGMLDSFDVHESMFAKLEIMMRQQVKTMAESIRDDLNLKSLKFDTISIISSHWERIGSTWIGRTRIKGLYRAESND